MPNTILLAGGGVRKEAVAAAGSAILPGDLLERSSATEVQEHSTGDGNALKMFALENPWYEAAGASIDQAYTVADNVMYIVAERGAEIYAWLAAGNNASVGAALSSDGAGKLQLVTTSAATSQAQRDGIVAYAKEAVNATTADLRIKVEVA